MYGRTLVAYKYRFVSFPFSFSQVKSFVYMMQCAADDEENQKLGIVGLLYHGGDQLNKPDPDLMSQGPATLHWVPIRFNGLHICVSHTMSSILARLLLIGAGREIRCRSRVHYGTFTSLAEWWSTLVENVDSDP